jgi:hypothetical protein
MMKWIVAVMCVFTCLLAQSAFAAVKFKRFPHCGEGLVTVKTCECHASNSRICIFVTPASIATHLLAAAPSSCWLRG